MFKDYISMYYLPIDIILIILLINFIIYIFSTYFKETKTFPLLVLFSKGKTGEYLTYRTLNKIEGYKKFLFNLRIPFDNNKTTEIDIVMLHNSGIYVLESKNYSGLILGNKTNDKWSEVLGNGQRYTFYNPVKQNNTHINALKHYLHDSSNYFYSFIVFANETELSNIHIDNVVNRRNLIDKINKLSNNKQLSNTQLDNIYNMLKNR